MIKALVRVHPDGHPQCMTVRALGQKISYLHTNDSHDTKSPSTRVVWLRFQMRSKTARIIFASTVPSLIRPATSIHNWCRIPPCVIPERMLHVCQSGYGMSSLHVTREILVHLFFFGTPSCTVTYAMALIR